MLPFSKIRSLILLVAFVLLVGGTGYRLGESHVFGGQSGQGVQQLPLINTQSPANTSVDFSLFWDVWQKMFNNYIDASTLDSQKMVWGAIGGMVAAAGDPYTSFFPPKENTQFKEDLGGQFEGIGAQLDIKEGKVIIVTPLKDSPAEKAGLKAGDYVAKVNNEDTIGWTLDQAVAKIRGPRGSSVTLTIYHPGSQKPVDLLVMRDTILVPSVESWTKAVASIPEIQNATESAGIKTKGDKISYIKLSRFGDHTEEDWTKAVDTLLTEQQSGGVKGLIFDLRNNPGGYLEGAVFIASEFLKSGTVVSQKNSDGTIQSLAVNRAGKLTDIPLVVLVNKGSASAAEIVSGALQDYKRAKLVGEVTFGKGSVQTPYELKNGASVHITTGKWLLPNGGSISQKGVTPDFIISSEGMTASSDAQLAKGIDLLLQ